MWGRRRPQKATPGRKTCLAGAETGRLGGAGQQICRQLKVGDGGGARSGDRGGLRPYRTGGAGKGPNGTRGPASGRRMGPFSVLGGPWRSQRRPGTRAAGPHVRAGGGQAPQEVAERGARAPFQRALQTAKAVEVTLSSGAGRRRACKTTCANLMCPTVDALSQSQFSCALSMASAGPAQHPQSRARLGRSGGAHIRLF